MTLTNRLMLFFLGTLALVLIGFSTTLYLFAWIYLHQQTEERLDAAVNTLVAAIEVTPDGVEWEPDERTLTVGPGPLGGQVAWSVRDDKGQVVAHAPGAAIEKMLVAAVERMNQQELSTTLFTWQGERWRVAHRWLKPAASAPPHELRTLPADVKQIKYPALAVAVGVPLEPVQAALRTLALVVAGLSLTIWLVALMVGRWVCRRALAPVTQMAAAARAMNSPTLEERLPASGTGDELADLSKAFNWVLDRLQESFDRQRRFTGDASHQLRTPLTAILGQIEVSLRRKRPAEDYERVLGMVQGQAVHLRRIVESLLFLSRADGEVRLPDLEPINLDEWLTKQTALWAELPRAHDIQIAPPTNGPYIIKAQAPMLAELVNNLLNNGLKYSQPGTPIGLRLDKTDMEVSLAIEDHGCGIREEDLPHVFEPFFRSSDARRRGVGGIGLGLAIASRLATAFGGRIEVRSQIDQGSCFTIHFPRVHEEKGI